MQSGDRDGQAAQRICIPPAASLASGRPTKIVPFTTYVLYMPRILEFPHENNLNIPSRCHVDIFAGTIRLRE